MILVKNPRSRLWLVAAVIFLLINVLGGLAAAWEGEWLHSGIHTVLALLGEFMVVRLVAVRRVSDEY
jgi:hypothetical protein